ncbi:unnamed protein product, partial [Prorocentrum cordatum]
VDAFFSYRPVVALPANFDQWRSHARHVLDRTGQGITQEAKDQILKYDNSDWTYRGDGSKDIIHFCPIDCDCGRTRQGALSKMKAVIKISIGANCPLALEYRWKHMEKANAWCYRGHPGARQTVKAGMIIDYMTKDPLGLSHRKVLTLQGPMQVFLDYVFKCEAVTTKFTNQACAVPGASAAIDGSILSSVHAALMESCRYNLAVLSGSRGRKVIISQAAAVRDFGHAMWDDIRRSCTRQGLFELCLLLLRSMGVAWRRLVHYFGQPKFQLLQVCGDLVTDLEIDRIVAPLREKKARCEKCLDPFTDVWLSRLCDEECRLKAQEALRLQIASTPVSSVAVEKKHLLGQEIRKPKSRGRAVQGAQLVRQTHHKLTMKVNAQKTSDIQNRVLKTAAARRSFGRLASSLSLSRRGVTDRAKEAKRYMRQPRAGLTRMSAWSLYKHINWTRGVKPFGAAGAAEQQRLSRDFKNITPATRAHYDAMAARGTTDRE